MKGYQQGDCIAIKIDAVPEGSKAVKPGPRGYVLAEGEHTGHAHCIDATRDVEMYEKDGVLYLKVAAPAPLTHEEHHTQTIEPGIYEVRRVVEVDPFSDEIRTVAD